MAEHRTVPPLSGEIMTGTSLARAARFDASGATEAEIMSVSHASTAPPFAASSISGRPEGMAVLSEPAMPAARERGGPLFWAFGLILAASAFWVSGGHALLASAPVAPAPVGVHLATLTTRIAPKGAGQIVLVDGELLNEGVAAAPVPSLDIAVTSRDGRVTHYVLGTSGAMMAPGARYPFSGRLDAPKEGAETVLVTVKREDGG